MSDLKQSGNKQQFDGGAQRDSQDDKPRPDLICPFFKERLGEQLRKGAVHYGEHNWAKGMPQSRVLASLERHLMAYQQGKTDEDHLAALAFNAMVLLSQDERIARGKLDARWALGGPTPKKVSDGCGGVVPGNPEERPAVVCSHDWCFNWSLVNRAAQLSTPLRDTNCED